MKWINLPNLLPGRISKYKGGDIQTDDLNRVGIWLTFAPPPLSASPEPGIGGCSWIELLNSTEGGRQAGVGVVSVDCGH